MINKAARLSELARRVEIRQILRREEIIDEVIAQFCCSTTEKNQLRQQFCKNHRISSKQQLETWLKQNLMCLEELEAKLERSMLIEKFKRQKFTNQLERYFLERKSKIQQIVYSQITQGDRGIASELYFRILEGEASFFELARLYSLGKEAYTGGIIGLVERGQLPEVLQKLFQGVKIGTLFPPLKIGELWYVLRFENQVSSELEDKLVQKRLLNELFEVWLEEQTTT